MKASIPPPQYRSPSCEILLPQRRLAIKGTSTKFQRARGHCKNPSRGLLGDFLCSLSTTTLQKASQLCYIALDFLLFVCLLLYQRKGFSSWKLLLHHVLVWKSLAEQHQLPSGCQNGLILFSKLIYGCSPPAVTSQSRFKIQSQTVYDLC